MGRFAAAVAISSLGLTLLPAVIATPARADVVIQGNNVRNCMGANSSNNITVAACNGGANQNFFNTASYGPQQFNGKCVQGTGEGQNLTLQACNGGNDQKWLADSNGQYRNQGGWCAEVRGSNVVSTNCGDKSRPKASQIWGRGVWSSGANTGVLAGAQPGAVFYGGRQVAQGSLSGGAGIVAQGGGNIVAQGGGNIVAQGGGNIISTNGGGIVAQGAGN